MVTQSEAIAEFVEYEKRLARILLNFVETRDSIHIDEDDDPAYRQYIQEIIDLFHDVMGENAYSKQIAAFFTDVLNNYVHSPSKKSVENILGLLRAALTRMGRNPDILRFAERDEHHLADVVPQATSNAILQPPPWYLGGLRFEGDVPQSDKKEEAPSTVLHARLLARLEAIEVAIDELKSRSEMMGHNNPPEPIGDILSQEELS